MNRFLAPATLAGLVVILIALSLYVSTLDNGLRLEELYGGDLVTHQYAQVEARPSNAPGYPLYTMGGWLWFRLGRLLLSPWFNPIEILSLYSTLWALASLITLYILLREATGDNWPIAALGTLFYSFTYFFWYYSASTEQYTSAVFQTLIMVLWLFRWERKREDKYLYGLALMTGLCLANLVTVLFILPPMLVLVVTGEPRIVRRAKLIGRSIILALVPLLSYLYVFVRGAQHPEWRGAGQWNSALQWFVSFLGTQQGRDEMTWVLGPLTAEFPGLIVWDMSAVGLLLAFVGWWLLGRRRGGFLFASLGIYLAFSYMDRFGNWYQVFMPMYPLLVVGIAVTADRLWRWARTTPRRRIWHGAILLGMVLLVASRLIYPDPRAFQNDRLDDDALRAGQTLLNDDPPQGATIIGNADQFVSLQYLTDIWGRRPDVKAAKLSDAAALIENQTPALFFTREIAPLILPEIGRNVCLAGHGAELVALNFQPASEIPGTARQLGAILGGSIELAAYQFTGEETPRAAHLTLYWRALKSVHSDWSVSVRPTLDGQLIPEGDGILQMDASNPVLGLYPTSKWSPHEIVRDDYVLPVPAGQEYDGFQIVLYRSARDGFENLGTATISLFP